MGLFDIFTNDNAEKAAAAQKASLASGYGQYAGLAGTGRDALTGNYAAGLASLTGNYGLGRDALTGNYGQAVNAFGSNVGASIGALDANAQRAVGALTGNYAAGLSPFLQNYQTAQAGTTALGNALGLNGPAGNAAATAAFWNNPAIKSQLDLGSENVLRHQSATGQLASGKTNIDLQNYGQQVASQGWNNYVSQLQPYLNFSQGAASGIGNLYSGLGGALANQYGNLGTQLAGQYGNLASGLGNLYTGLGGGLNANFMNLGGAANQNYTSLAGQLANSFGTQGQAAYGTQVGQGNADANAALAANNASANIWNAVMQGGKLATQAIPGSSFAGGLMKFMQPQPGGGAATVAGFADGGRPPIGDASIVGERGPELFVPDQPGTIIPNEALTSRRMYDFVRRNPALLEAFLSDMPSADQSPALRASHALLQDRALVQDTAENAFGAQVLLPNDARRFFGSELTPAQRISETFLAARGATPMMSGRGSRFTPMGGIR